MKSVKSIRKRNPGGVPNEERKKVQKNKKRSVSRKEKSAGLSPSTESITTISKVEGGSSSPTPSKMSQTPPQQYCLRWNNYQNNLTNVFDQLLQSEAFVDVTLACDGNSLKAHKMVLSACSPFFQTLFFDNPCSHPIVILKDINWDELKSVVEFMYRGEINVSQEQLAPLLKVAEMLKIRGLADVSRGSGSVTDKRDGNGESGSSASSNRPNPADFMSTNHDSEPGSPLHSNGLLNHPLLQGHHLNPLNSLLNASSSTSSNVAAAHAHALASLHRRKRRKMSTPERTPSPPEDDLDEHSSNQLEVDSTNGDWNNDHSPRSLTADRASLSGEQTNTGLSLSVANTPTPANTPSLSAAAAAAATVGMSLASGSSLGSSSSPLVGPLGPAFLNLHAAAAAAVASANSNAGGSGGSGGNNPPSTSSSLASDLDLKPGIVEMIREEERAKMLESSHGWLGPSAASTLTDTYQYQIQNLWQKCWNQNQGGVVHALRFRERGPLKSWRPETMAEAIFAVLRDGLSLSQAARKYDIPYPTFVLYANRVHNMLGPSADGCSGTDLMSDMRPKGRGRPQRILLGSWPEEHIRGVIRAVVFRDTPGGKDDFPFIFNRETGLCLPQTSGSSSHNGSVDMSQFSNPFLNPTSTAASLLQQSSTTATSSSGNSGSAGASQTPTNLSSSAGSTNTTNSLHGVSLINLSEHGAAAATVAALQHLQQLEQQGSLSTSSLLAPGSPQSNSNSPLQQVLSSAAAGLLSVQAQRELVALQQRHQLQQQRRHSLSNRDRDDAPSPLSLLTKKGLSSLQKDTSSPGLITDSELLQIKAELPLGASIGADDDIDNDNDEGNNLGRGKLDEEEGNDHAEMIRLNEGDEEEQFSTALKHCVNNPGQSASSSSSGGSGNGGCGGSSAQGEMMEETDLVKFLNRGEADVISGNNESSSPKSSRSPNATEGNGKTNTCNNNNGPKGSASSNAGNNHNNNGGNSNRTSSRGIESNNEALLEQDGQGMMTPLAEPTSRRASLRGSSEGVASQNSPNSTRTRASSRSGEREVNTPEPLNFIQNQASTS